MRDDMLIKKEKTGTVTGILEYGNHGNAKWGSRSLDIGLLLLRLAVGGLMLFHGIAKLNNGVEMMKPMLATNGLPEWLIYGLYIAEVLAPVMIIMGFWTRLAAATIVFDMIMAIFLVHSHDVLSLNKSGAWAIEIEAFYFLTALALIFTGGGMYRIKRSTSRWD
jgi:putative oxidoreductase